MPLWQSVGVNDKFAQINLARLDLGMPVLLCAPGPSLKPIERQPGVFIAALTKAYPTVKPDIWFGMDEPGCYDRRIWAEACIKVGNSAYPDRAVEGRKIRDFPLTFLAQCKRSRDVTDIFKERGNDKEFAWYKHTLGTALDVLTWMGAQEFLFDGFDLRHIDGKDYCDGARKTLPPALRARNQQLFDQQVKFLRFFHAVAQANDIKCVSVTPDSPINEFMPFLDREAALAKIRARVPDPGQIYHCREIDPKNGTEMPVMLPFSPSGLAQAIKDAKARKNRIADLDKRRAEREAAATIVPIAPAEVTLLKEAAAAVESEGRLALEAKTPDTPDNFRKVWSKLKGPIIAAAMPLRRPVPIPTTINPRIGLFFPSSNVLAHTTNAITLVRGLEQIGNPVEPVIYSLGAHNDAFLKAFPHARLCKRSSTLESYMEVRRRAVADQLSAMVFVSHPGGMAFLSTMGVAPKHVWWAHKWHGLELPYLDGYIDACHPFRDSVTLDGRTWPCTYTAVPDMFDPDYTAQAREIRARQNAQIVFGSMCREEKLTEAYAQAVSAILDQTPNSIYVYCGRQPQPWFERAVGTIRCKHIGWVNTKCWAQVIDVYLDTFPFQSGHTAFEAMAASKPVVWMDSPAYGEEQGVTEFFAAGRWQGIYRADPVSRDSAAYVARGIALARDAALRADDGAAGRDFLDIHMRDERRMALSFVKVLTEIIDRPVTTEVAA